ncbi:MAG: 8-amino-7-oxononanoate synthase, partial [Pseudomonadales bacterium]
MKLDKKADISYQAGLEFSADTDKLRQQGLYRKERIISARNSVNIEIDGQPLINFCSNDYLDLACDPRISTAMNAAAQKFGTGSGASPLVSGKTVLHHELEELLAQLTGRDRVLLFSCGYMANLAVISGLVRSRGDEVFEDKLCHASMIDGAAISPACLKRYQHASPASLKKLLLTSSAKRKLVLTESVFSMDGDIAPITEIARCCHEQQACLVVDDAHGFGVIGNKGWGGLDFFDLDQSAVPLLMATFGKAVGVSGAFIAGPDSLLESLVQGARPYIYSTAPPIPLVAAIKQSLHIMSEEPERRLHLDALIQRFRTGAEHLGIKLLPSETPIQPVVIGDPDETVDVSRRLEQQGFFVSAIRPPTVPANTSRLRITLSAGHAP